MILQVPPEVFEWAKAERARRDAEYGQGYGGGMAWSQESPRWKGPLCEWAFDFVLGHLGVPRVWNGGIDNEPDFVVHGVGVGVKHSYSGLFARVDEYFSKRPNCEWYAFARLDGRAVTIMGLKQLSCFYSESQFIPKGGVMLDRGIVAKNGGYELPSELLVPLESFLVGPMEWDLG